MYRVEIGLPNANGFYEWKTSAGIASLRGRSREPLLDACRAVREAGADLSAEIRLFRKGCAEWDLKCQIGWGAAHTVDERRRCFVKWRSSNFANQLEAAE
jgi:hypothetical protein